MIFEVERLYVVVIELVPAVVLTPPCRLVEVRLDPEGENKK